MLAEAPAGRLRFTPNQRRGFFAAWCGIVLDGVDSFIYALVLVPALRALLPASGIEPTVGNVSVYGSILFSVFLIGWGMAFLWGPLADRFGRVRVLMLAILCYSLFTFLGAVAQTWWQLALFRLLAGLGIGGEFVGAATFVVEELPERRRVMGTGIMNSGYYVGIFIAATLNYLIGARYGWRAMFALGGLPALFIAYVRLNVREPERWRNRVAEIGDWRARDAFFTLFSPEYQATDPAQLRVPADLNDRPLGRVGLRAVRRHAGGDADGARRGRRGAYRIARDDAAGGRHDHRVSHHADALRTGLDAAARWRSSTRSWPSRSQSALGTRSIDRPTRSPGSSDASFSSASAAAASRCIGPGSASSTARSAAVARWRSPPRLEGSSPRAQHSWSDLVFNSTAVSACRSR